MNPIKTRKVGEVRPSQTIFSYGVGALIDLPNLSVVVTGLDDWQVRSNEARVIRDVTLALDCRHRCRAAVNIGHRHEPHGQWDLLAS